MWHPCQSSRLRSVHFKVRAHGRNIEQPIDDDCVAGCGWQGVAAGIALGDAAGGGGVSAPLRVNLLPGARRAVVRA